MAFLSVNSGPGDLSFITWTAEGENADLDGGIRRAYEEIGRRLDAADLIILHERVFGEASTAGSVAESRAAGLGEDSTNALIPPTHIEGALLVGAAQ